MYRRNDINVIAMVTLLTWCLFPINSLAVVYMYDDNYETNKAETDSYLHSPILETVPDEFLYGVLAYGILQPYGNRVLGFYEGFEVDSYAYLAYRMPLEENHHPITHAQVQFQIVDTPHLFPGSTEVYLLKSNDGVTWPYVQQITFGMHYMPLFEEGNYTYFQFMGTGFAVDELHVYMELDETTTAVNDTWGGVKALYR